ncbi:uncharacterized protein Tco025E_08534, partial [Trypanosoma conorhini]
MERATAAHTRTHSLRGAGATRPLPPAGAAKWTPPPHRTARTGTARRLRKVPAASKDAAPPRAHGGICSSPQKGRARVCTASRAHHNGDAAAPFFSCIALPHSDADVRAGARRRARASRSIARPRRE